MHRKILVILLTAVPLAIVSDYLFYGKPVGISLLMFSTVSLGSTWVLARTWGMAVRTASYALALLLQFFALMVFVRANPLLQFLDVLAVLYLGLLIVKLQVQPSTRLRDYPLVGYIRRISILPIEFLAAFISSLQLVVSSRRKKVRPTTLAAIIRGVALSIPFLFIFVLLLSSADLVFKKYIGSLVSFKLDISPEILGHGFFLLLMTSLIGGALALLFAHSETETIEPVKAESRSVLGFTEASILLGSVSGLFLIFVIIQIAYLFGGEQAITSAGYTYANYARKGFFELIVVAIITLLLIWAVKQLAHQRSRQHILGLRWLSLSLVLEVLVMMASAHLRLGLYERAYGFTMLRLVSHLFIGWLAVMFVLLSINIVRQQRAQQLAFQTFVSLVIFLGLFNLISPDAFIARGNIDRLQQRGTLDVVYLQNLSTDAVPAIGELLDSPSQEVQKATAHLLYQKQQLLLRKNMHWQSANLADSRARQILEINQTKLEQNKDYFPTSNEIRASIKKP